MKYDFGHTPKLDIFTTDILNLGYLHSAFRSVTYSGISLCGHKHCMLSEQVGVQEHSFGTDIDASFGNSASLIATAKHHCSICCNVFKRNYIFKDITTKAAMMNKCI